VAAIVGIVLAFYFRYREIPDHALKRLADGGDPAAQVLYSTRLSEASGHQTPESLKYLKLAVDQEYPEAEAMYGLMLTIGNGLPEDQEEAAKYLKRAADHGNKDAQSIYADCLDMGRGVERNHAEAARYRELAGKKHKSIFE
jgi:TPR repeat protein